MTAWIALLFAGAGSFAFRFGVVAVIDRWSLPAWFERASAFVLPASFAGLAAVALVHPTTSGSGLALPAAAIVTVGVAHCRSPSSAVLAGMVVIWGARALAGVA